MVKGDIVNGFLSAAAFQPAASVEIMITNLSGASGGGTAEWEAYDGVIRGRLGTIAASTPNLAVCKFGITNSLYIHVAQNGAYSGVQVK